VRHLKYLALLAILVLPAAYSHAQVSIGVQIGPSYGIYNAPPVCEWGFYPDYPFGCAPYGYWGPEYFADGVFIGVGPWYNFYYTHPGFYRRYYVNRGFGYYGGYEHFRGGPRVYERERFRGNDGFRDRGGRSFNGSGEFHGRENFRGDSGRSFNGGGRSFRGDNGRGEFRGGGDRSRGDSGRASNNGGGRSFRGGGDSRGGGQCSGDSRGGDHDRGGHR